MTIYSKNFGGKWPLCPPSGYVYACTPGCMGTSVLGDL